MADLFNTVTGAVETGLGAVRTSLGAVTGAVGTGVGAVGTGIGAVGTGLGLINDGELLRKEAEKKEAAASKAKQEAEQDKATKIKQAAALKAEQEAELARIAAENAALDKDTTQQAYKKKFDSIITNSNEITCKIKEYNDINFDNNADLKDNYKINDYYIQLIKLTDGLPNRVRKIIQFFYENNPKFGETQKSYYKAGKKLTLIITIKQDNENIITINIPLNTDENIVESFTINDIITTFSEIDKLYLSSLVKDIMNAIKPINFYGDNTFKLNNKKKMKILIDVSNQRNGTNTKVGNSQAISSGLGNTLSNITSFIQFNGGKRKTRKNKKTKKSTKKNKQKRNKNNKKQKTLKSRKTLKN